MKAAIVREYGRPPEYGDFPDPVPGPGEILLSVRAAALNRLTRSRASGTHYSAGGPLPFVAGVDGVGRTDDGRRVFFGLPRPPYGSMAERSVARAGHLVPVPDGIDDVTVAAAANPGMSCWIPLTRRAPVRRGEGVLVLGATGTAGRVAVQVAKYLGAATVIAAGRDPARLEPIRELGADVLLPLGGPPDRLREEVRRAVRDASVGVVLDYLWGPIAETVLAALGGPGAPRGSAPVRYVEVGSLAGDSISLDGATLRSAGIELLGSGIGSTDNAELLAGIGEFLEAFVRGRFRIAVEPCPLSEVGRAWGADTGDRRRVFTVP